MAEDNPRGIDLDGIDTEAFVDFEAIYSPLSSELKGPATLAEAEALLTEASPELDGWTVYECMNKHFYSLEIARLAARHPSTADNVLQNLDKFLPEEVATNPTLAARLASERWKNYRPQGPGLASPSRWDWGYGVPNDSKINAERPELWKVLYWMKYGSSADKRYMASIEPMYDLVLEHFAQDKAAPAPLRKALATRKRIPPQLLDTLATDRAKTVRAALAGNEHVAAEILLTLAGDREESVRNALLANPACPETARHEAYLINATKPSPHDAPLKELKDADIIALLGSPETSIEKLAELAVLEAPWVRAGCALHRNAEPTLLSQLAGDKDILVRESTAYNPHTPPEALETLLNSGEERVLEGLAGNDGLGESLQLRLATLINAGKTSDRIGRYLADTTNSPTVWEKLAEMECKASKGEKGWCTILRELLDPQASRLFDLQRNYRYRYLFLHKLIARHPNCPEKLYGHYAYYLFDSLAQNPKVAIRLLENPNAITPKPFGDGVLDMWFSNSTAPGHVVSHYLKNVDIERKRKAASCYSARPAQLQQDVFEPDIHTRKWLARYRKMTPFSAEILARDKQASVRNLVAQNEHTPPLVLAFLAKDKSAAVRAAALQNKKFPVLDADDVKTSATDGAEVPANIPRYANQGKKRDRERMAEQAVDAKILADLSADRHPDVRKRVADNKNTNRVTILSLLSDSESAIRLAALRHKHITNADRMSLVTDEEAGVRALTVNYLYLSSASYSDDYPRGIIGGDESMLEPFYQDDAPNILRLLAEYTGNPEMHARLARHEDVEIRKVLAANLRLSSDISRQIMVDPEKWVVQALVSHTPHPDIYRELLESRPELIGTAKKNSRMHTDPELNTWLARHSDAKFRAVAVRGCRSSENIRRLAADPSPAVQQAWLYAYEMAPEAAEILLLKPSPDIVETLTRQEALWPICAAALDRWLDGEKVDSRCIEKMIWAIPLNEQQQRSLLKMADVTARTCLLYNSRIKLATDVLAALEQDTHRKVREALRYYHKERQRS